MKRYPVARARERLADVLNEVDRTGGVLIERGDVQYEIRRKRTSRRRRGHQSVIEILDPAVADGQWFWQPASAGVRFKPRTRS